jgi:hypothetical protein
MRNELSRRNSFAAWCRSIPALWTTTADQLFALLDVEEDETGSR